MAQERNRKQFRVASAQSLTGNGGRRVGVAGRGGLGRHLVRCKWWRATKGLKQRSVVTGLSLEKGHHACGMGNGYMGPEAAFHIVVIR